MSEPHPFFPTMEYAFTIAIELAGLQWVKPTAQGDTRAAIYAASGTVTGPMLQGTVIPMSGGDFPLVRPNGVIDFDARYLLEADDGAVIYMQNRGYRWAQDARNRREDVAQRAGRARRLLHASVAQVRCAGRAARMDDEAHVRRRRRENPARQPHPLFRGAADGAERFRADHARRRRSPHAPNKPPLPPLGLSIRA